MQLNTLQYLHMLSFCDSYMVNTFNVVHTSYIITLLKHFHTLNQMHLPAVCQKCAFSEIFCYFTLFYFGLFSCLIITKVMPNYAITKAMPIKRNPIETF